MFFAIDIDGTITEPRWYDPDVQRCMERYIKEGIVAKEDVEGLQYHPQFFLLPQVAITHLPLEGAAEALHNSISEGSSLQYFTARNHRDPEICKAIYHNTHLWLDRHHFPSPMNVSFFWDVKEKLLHALEQPDLQIVLIDDRPEGILKAYSHIQTHDAQKAQEILARITLVAFGLSQMQAAASSGGLTVVPLPDWSHFRKLLSDMGKS